ncbi:regulatory protein RecX [Shivajiella indica]|uniref:Regulatory protein RecX n=1 Tax=Shivajiella indica TaxID=872115 RepID=A0ABW5B3Q5_9BACT
MSYPRKEYNPDQPKKYWTMQEAKIKIAAYCAYQERYQEEVRNKLSEKGIFGNPAEELISLMIEEDFLNEERFAQAFVRGKYKLKKWGKNKILQELKFRQISPNCIKSGMKEIDTEEYWQNLFQLTEKKWSLIKDKDLLKKKYKVQQYLISRGYEIDLIQRAIDEMISDQNL